MVLAALSWAVFAVLSTLVMRPFVRLSASSPEAIAYGVTYGRIVCIGSLGTFLEGIWSKVHQAGCNMKLPMLAQVTGAVINVVLDLLLIFGVGGLPEQGGFFDCLRDWMSKGRLIVLTTQVPSEGSDVGVYHVGHSLKTDLKVLEAYDMTTEAVVAKLMWILGQTHDRAEAERLFYTPVAKDILFPSG